MSLSFCLGWKKSTHITKSFASTDSEGNYGCNKSSSSFAAQKSFARSGKSDEFAQVRQAWNHKILRTRFFCISLQFFDLPSCPSDKPIDQNILLQDLIIKFISSSNQPVGEASIAPCICNNNSQKTNSYSSASGENAHLVPETFSILCFSPIDWEFWLQAFSTRRTTYFKLPPETLLHWQLRRWPFREQIRHRVGRLRLRSLRLKGIHQRQKIHFSTLN